MTQVARTVGCVLKTALVEVLITLSGLLDSIWDANGLVFEWAMHYDIMVKY